MEAEEDEVGNSRMEDGEAGDGGVGDSEMEAEEDEAGNSRMEDGEAGGTPTSPLYIHGRSALTKGNSARQLATYVTLSSTSCMVGISYIALHFLE